MRTEKFEKWLVKIRLQKPNVVRCRIANCRRVEQYYHDLDNHFQKDGGRSLMDLLTYSTDDQRYNKPTQHNIPIDGDVRTGSATLKQAVHLYMLFCDFERNNGQYVDVPTNHITSVPQRKFVKRLDGYNRIIKSETSNISYKKLFGDYIEGATEFVVKDPYIRFPYQLRNFIELCSLIEDTKQNEQIVHIHLVTNKNDEFLENTRKSFEEMISSLSNQGITLSYEFSDILHDRSIEMNNGWKIILGRGLDIWHKTTGRFDIAEFDQEKRLCKEFEITVIRQ